MVDTRNDVAVLVIDMQKNFVRRLDKKVRERVVSAQISVLEECVRSNIPVVILEYYDEEDTVDRLRQVVARAVQTATIIKSDYDGFYKTNLDEVLKKFKARTLILMGMNAGACVLETAKSAHKLGYKVFTSEDLIADSETDGMRDDSIKWYLKNECFATSPLAAAGIT